MAFARHRGGPVERAFHAMQRESRVLSNESFRAHSIARLYGIENRIVLADRPREPARFGRNYHRRWRGESDGLDTIERKLQHRAFRNCDKSLVKSQIQFAEACHLPGSRRFRGPERSDRLGELRIDAACAGELRGIGDSPRRQTRSQTLQRAARLNRIRDVLLGENTRRVSARGQLFQQPFVVQFCQRRTNDWPGCVELLGKLNLLDCFSRGQFAAQDHLSNRNQNQCTA